MVLDGSTSLRGVTEIGKVLEGEYPDGSIPERMYLITYGGPGRNILLVSVQNALVLHFLRFNFDEIIAIRTAANMSFYNPIERVHSRCNLGLQR